MATDDDDLEAQAARLRAQPEEMRARDERRRQAREWTENTVHQVRGTAGLGDELVRATADHTGLLTDLVIRPEALECSRASELAKVVTTVVRRAAAQARGQVRDVYTGPVNERMIADLPSHLPTVPTVPDQPPSLPRTSAPREESSSAKPVPPDVSAPPAPGPTAKPDRDGPPPMPSSRVWPFLDQVPNPW